MRRVFALLAVATLATSMSLVRAAAASAQTAPGSPAVIAVPHDYPTIQAAVDAAAPGSSVVVGPGVYVGEVVIDKDLQLTGAGIGATVVKAPATLTSYGSHLPDLRPVTAIVRVGSGAHVRIARLTVSGPIPCGIETSGINVYEAATLDLTSAQVTGVRPDPAACAADNAAGRAVVYGLPAHIVADGVVGSPAYGRISHVLVDHYQHAGISVTGPDSGTPSRVQVTDNVVIGGAALPSFQYGIHASDGVVATVARNTVLDNICAAVYCGPDPISQAQAAGVFLESVIPGTAVTDNRLSDNDVGVYQVVSPDCCVIAHNTLLVNRYFGILIQDGDGSARANVIVGGRVGVGVAADFVDTTGRFVANRIVGTSLGAVRTIECCGVTATAIVTPN